MHFPHRFIYTHTFVLIDLSTSCPFITSNVSFQQIIENSECFQLLFLTQLHFFPSLVVNLRVCGSSPPESEGRLSELASAQALRDLGSVNVTSCDKIDVARDE
ncbi:hypothetical protein NPIL_466291 [Nephila pilipes]|uniref:Uncharacterized protein n=1 Tax=Nephila pilipes TaxID=299642 RepID=A0A8X6PQN6_NEPPI|nr:hypothetical protein NPIL_577581 [Nephila pilipes]GFT88449.1 hypothetical protein NPIL_466291 [Nephila pilipes]